MENRLTKAFLIIYNLLAWPVILRRDRPVNGFQFGFLCHKGALMFPPKAEVSR